MTYQVVTKTDASTGPVMEFSDSAAPTTPFLKIGAYDNKNHIDSGNRGLVIDVNGQGMNFKGLGPVPSGKHTHDLVVDEDGNVYIQ